MSGLFSSLNASAGTLDAYARALNVIQNNVGNASTPGYAGQVATLQANLFDPVDGTGGGSGFAGSRSLRNEYAEQYVQQQNSSLGSAEAQANALEPLESSFDITNQSGVDGSLSQFFTSFSALSQDPNSTTARQQALTSAQNVAAAFQSAASAAAQASSNADGQIQSTVQSINYLASQIQGLNQQRMTSGQPDPNADATLHADLESLSELVNFTASFSPQGAVTVLIGGETPLVIGADVHPIQSGLAPTDPNAPEPSGNPPQMIKDSAGTDITAQISGGQLAGYLKARNSVIPGIIGDRNQPGSLNQLAQAFADRVNTVLTSGQVSAGPPPVPGVPLFQYAAGNNTGIAATLSVTSITPQQIATITPGPPSVANGIPSQIASLPNSVSAADQINGLSFTAFYGQMAGDFGQQLSNAKTAQQLQTDAVVQAKNLRAQVSGVSLDQEAVNLTEFQRAYQATAKLVSTIDELTQTTIDLIR